jgi:hypothetical protein
LASMTNIPGSFASSLLFTVQPPVL